MQYSREEVKAEKLREGELYFETYRESRNGQYPQRAVDPIAYENGWVRKCKSNELLTGYDNPWE